MPMDFGIDHLLDEPALIEQLKGMQVGLVAHPASVTADLSHTLDALVSAGIQVKRAFGPQHGMRGDKQDNMIESPDYVDPLHQIPVISLYGEHRRPTTEMLQDLDVVLFDLQDVGCRIYTYITTLRYFVEACATSGIALWVLDRPNPIGRMIDGLSLEAGQESFVGADSIPTRHGLTVGELAHYFASKTDPALDLTVIHMRSYDVTDPWPVHLPWVNPSPNAASLNMTRCFPGTVLLEGTTLSEGRGTTIPLEVMGAPQLPVHDLIQLASQQAPDWYSGAVMRPCFFEPTFHKHVHEMCAGIQIHTDHKAYRPEQFYPFRVIAGLLKALRLITPDYDIWRHHEYEYELNRIPVDVINGGPGLREWVDRPEQTYEDLEALLIRDAKAWQSHREPFLIY